MAKRKNTQGTTEHYAENFISSNMNATTKSV